MLKKENMARSELHIQFATWLRSRVGRAFSPGSDEWEVIQLAFETYRHTEWVKRALKCRVVWNDKGHPGIDFFAPDDSWYRPGEWTPVSWASCFAGGGSRERVRRTAAMRRGVEDQISRFRGSVPKPWLCPVSGEPCGENAHVDHSPPNTFAALVEAFIAIHGAPEIKSVSTFTGPEIADPEVLRLWKEFHGSRAKLRWLSKKANISFP